MKPTEQPEGGWDDRPIETEEDHARARKELRAELGRTIEEALELCDYSNKPDAVNVILETAASEATMPISTWTEEAFLAAAKTAFQQIAARKKDAEVTCLGQGRYCCRRSTYDPRKVKGGPT